MLLTHKKKTHHKMSQKIKKMTEAGAYMVWGRASGKVMIPYKVEIKAESIKQKTKSLFSILIMYNSQVFVSKYSIKCCDLK